MNQRAKRFGELVDQLVQHIAFTRIGPGKYRYAELLLASDLNVSQATIQTWRQGKHMPMDPVLIGEKLVIIGVRQWDLDCSWAESILIQTKHPDRNGIMMNLCGKGRFNGHDLESPEDPVPLNSPFYIKRNEDQLALEYMTRQGVTMTIKGPAKMGKTSLLYRVRAAAENVGKRTVCLNFREFGGQTLHDANIFFPQFCHLLSEELDLNDQVQASWNKHLPNLVNCRRYFTRYVLRELKQPLVLALENADMIFGSPFRSDFFAMVRSWHDDSLLWNKLDRVLVISTEPYQFIKDINKSPFNVSEVINLDDFTLSQVTELNLRHGTPLTDGELKRLMALLHGHPYLTRRALYLVTKGLISVDTLFATAIKDNGPFQNHLKALLADLLSTQKELRQAFQRVISQKSRPDDQSFFRLRGAGLVRDEGAKVWPRCQLYADFFKERLNV